MSVEQEIRDLSVFGCALRQENRLLFEQMMSELEPDVLQAAGLAKDPFEVIAMALIFQRNKTIRELIKKLEQRQEP